MIILLLTSTFFSCVSPRVVNDLRSDRDSLQTSLITCTTERSEFKTENDSLVEEHEMLTKQVRKLEKDTTLLGNSYRKLNSLYTELNNTYEKIIASNKELISEKSAKSNEILVELNTMKDKLKQKQDELLKKEMALKERNEKLQSLSSQLDQREQKVNELEHKLNQKDSALQNLKTTINKALFNFLDKGVTVETRNNKIYLTLEEQLLFPSGKYTVDKKGEQALLEIAKVLKQNPDITVMVEGHTDDVPVISGSRFKDNWELSVLRATEVVKILNEKGDIPGNRLIAAGRSYYVPVIDKDTPEARTKNRRTEIILTPDLKEIFDLINKSD